MKGRGRGWVSVNVVVVVVVVNVNDGGVDRLQCGFDLLFFVFGCEFDF